MIRPWRRRVRGVCPADDPHDPSITPGVVLQRDYPGAAGQRWLSPGAELVRDGLAELAPPAEVARRHRNASVVQLGGTSLLFLGCAVYLLRA